MDLTAWNESANANDNGYFVAPPNLAEESYPDKTIMIDSTSTALCNSASTTFPVDHGDSLSLSLEECLVPPPPSEAPTGGPPNRVASLEEIPTPPSDLSAAELELWERPPPPPSSAPPPPPDLA